MNFFFSSYKGGITLFLISMLIGFIGVTFFNALLSSSVVFTYVFVGLVTAIGLCSAFVIARTFYKRHNPFKKL